MTPPRITPEQLADALPELLKSMGNGSALLMHDDDGQAMVTAYKPNNIGDLIEEGFLYITAMALRPGALRFYHELEHTFFPPRSPLNMEFSAFHMLWQDMYWIGCRIPIQKRDCAEIIARKTGMHIADGIPTIVTGGSFAKFPLDGPTVFTLENAKGSKVYEGMAAAEEMRKDEMMELNKEKRQND